MHRRMVFSLSYYHFTPEQCLQRWLDGCQKNNCFTCLNSTPSSSHFASKATCVVWWECCKEEEGSVKGSLFYYQTSFAFMPLHSALDQFSPFLFVVVCFNLLGTISGYLRIDDTACLVIIGIIHNIVYFCWLYIGGPLHFSSLNSILFYTYGALEHPDRSESAIHTGATRPCDHH